MQLLTKKDNKSKQLIRTIKVVFLMLLVLSGISSCSKKEAVIEKNPEILLVDNITVEKPEIMVYVYQVVDEFQRIGGENVWEFEDFSGGKSAVEVAKEAVLENIIRMKVINKKATELGIKLTVEQEENAKVKAEEYFKTMKDEYIEAHGITISLMMRVFSEFALTNEVIANITSDFTPSSELVEARMVENEEYNRVKVIDVALLLTEIEAQHIFIETRIKQSSGDYVSMSESDKVEKRLLAEKVYQQAADGIPFEDLMKEYSDEKVVDESQTMDDVLTIPEKRELGEYVFSKGLLEKTPFASLMKLQEGEISQIIEDEAGFHLFKIKVIIVPTEERILSFDEEFKTFEAGLRQSIEKDVINESFEQLYKQWKELVNVTLDKEQWNQISLQN